MVYWGHAKLTIPRQYAHVPFRLKYLKDKLTKFISNYELLGANVKAIYKLEMPCKNFKLDMQFFTECNKTI